jgi:hypothetical protein
VLIKLTGFLVLSLIVLMVIPSYAEVTEVSIGKSFYTIDEKISFLGNESEGSVLVNVVVKDPNGKAKLLGGFSDPEGGFETIPQNVKNIFSTVGTYNATAFVYKIENGTSLYLQFDGTRVLEIQNFVLQLNSISDKEVNVEKTITFTASLTDSSITNTVFSLNNAPSGATIDQNSGKFVWTPSKSHGNIQDVFYTFDVVATNGNQEDREKVTITVKKAYEESEPKQTTPEPKELEVPASFVDETKDPQSYVDRYNKEASYKKWFDDNFSEYESIYQAVGLEKPKELAPFVDPNLDPQYYIDRYNREDTYKKWFDETYPDITIYDAVGVQEPEIEEPVVEESEFGECGEGTELIDGMCVIIDNSEGGGCLIATATYGTELAPQVQLLREIRDNQLMNTHSGASFMTGFNQFYYSFSPIVADMERENPVFREAVKIGITPLLSSLVILSHAESESEVLGYGIGVILMNIGMYFVAPALLFYKFQKRKDQI